MAALTNKERFIQINTPLGADALLVRGFTGYEELSRLFRYELELVSESKDLDPKNIVGKNVTWNVLHEDSTQGEFFNGFCIRFELLPSRGRLYHYRMVVAPWLWFLTLAADCRIYQDMKADAIIKKLFDELGFSGLYEFRKLDGGKLKERPYCVQFRETTFNFVSRLLEDEGIFYYFVHENGEHKMILSNQISAFEDLEYNASVRMSPSGGAGADVGQEIITHWERQYQFTTGKWAHTDYDPEKSGTKLIAETQTVVPIAETKSFEIYDYTGEYKDKGVGTTRLNHRMEEEEVQWDTVSGEGVCRDFEPGHKFTLEKHERRDQNKKYALVAVRHAAVQGSFLGEAENIEASYSNSFTCIPDDVKYRPARRTPKPVIAGLQSAVVTGSPGEEIYVDKYGRIKVQFHWDREGKADDNTTCYIRATTPGWAGNQWGIAFWPRVGQEVMVAFRNGDADEPVVVGTAWNDEHMPPYDLPGNKTISTIKTNSSKGSGGCNEIRFEDKKGSEQVFYHAEKDLHIRAKNDRLENIEASRSLTVGGDKFEKVEGDTNIDIGGDHNEKTGGQHSLNVTGASHEKSGGSMFKKSTQDVHIDGGMNVNVKAGMSISLKVGGNFINIGPSGVAIKGTMVLINSGGMATAAQGASPTAPNAPSDADEATAGTTWKPKKAKRTAPKPFKFSPTALQLKQASSTGAALCPV